MLRNSDFGLCCKVSCNVFHCLTKLSCNKKNNIGECFKYFDAYWWKQMWVWVRLYFWTIWCCDIAFPWGYHEMEIVQSPPAYIDRHSDENWCSYNLPKKTWSHKTQRTAAVLFRRTPVSTTYELRCDPSNSSSNHTSGLAIQVIHRLPTTIQKAPPMKPPTLEAVKNNEKNKSQT